MKGFKTMKEEPWTWEKTNKESKIKLLNESQEDSVLLVISHPPFTLYLFPFCVAGVFLPRGSPVTHVLHSV